MPVDLDQCRDLDGIDVEGEVEAGGGFLGSVADDMLDLGVAQSITLQ